MANEKNIIVGAAQIWVGDAGAITTPPAGTSTTLTGFTPVGFTSNGVEVAYAPDYGDVNVDQLLDSARIFKQGMKVTVNTTFSEATLDNLLVIWGQAGPVTGASVNILAGSLGEAPVERSLLFVGPAPSPTTAQERLYWIARAVQTESSSFALRKSETTGLPASFRCLPDPNASGGASYGTIRDRAVTTLLTSLA
jgi:hypothetical protein